VFILEQKASMKKSITIEKRGVFGKIRYMRHIWRMWRMVHKLHRIQTDYFKLEERDQKNLEALNMTLFRSTELYVQRHILSLKTYHGSMIVGTREGFKNLPRERRSNQDVIDSCIEAEFMKKGNPQKEDSRKSVALTEEGLKFREFDYFLKYAIKEVGIVYSFIFSIIASLTTGGIIGLIVNVLN